MAERAKAPAKKAAPRRVEPANAGDEPVYIPPIPGEKPGWTTSEFWLTLGNAVVSLVAAVLGLLTPGFTLDPQVQALVVAAAPIAAAVGVMFYNLSRGRVKAEQIRAATVLHVEQVQRSLALPRSAAYYFND